LPGIRTCRWRSGTTAPAADVVAVLGLAMKPLKIAGWTLLIFLALVGAYFIFFDVIPVQIEYGWRWGW
jgi:hypothetical protein